MSRFDEDVERYLAGEMSHAEAASFELILAEDDERAEYVARHRRLVSALSDLSDEWRPDLSTGVMQRLDESDEWDAPDRARTRGRLGRAVRRTATAAVPLWLVVVMLAAAVGVTWLLTG